MLLWLRVWAWKRVLVEARLRRRVWVWLGEKEVWLQVQVRLWAMRQVRVRMRVWMFVWVRVRVLVRWCVVAWVVVWVSSQSARIRSGRSRSARHSCNEHISLPFAEVAGSRPVSKTRWPSTSGPPSAESLPDMETEAQSPILSQAVRLCYVEGMPAGPWMGRSTPHRPRCGTGRTHG